MDRKSQQASALLLASVMFASSVTGAPSLELLDLATRGNSKKGAHHVVHKAGFFSSTMPKLEREKAKEPDHSGHLDPSEHINNNASFKRGSAITA